MSSLVGEVGAVVVLLSAIEVAIVPICPSICCVSVVSVFRVLVRLSLLSTSPLAGKIFSGNSIVVSASDHLGSSMENFERSECLLVAVVVVPVDCLLFV